MASAAPTQYNLRTFYVMTFTQVLSIIGSSMTSFAIAIWIFTETGDTTPLLLVSFFTWIPRMLFASFAGALADRLSRKKLIIWGDAAQAIPTLLVMLSFTTNNFEIWHVYAMALVQSVFAMMQGPAFQASVTMLVPDEQRDRANAVMVVMGPMAGLIAPMVAGFLYAFVAVEGVMLIDLLTFLIAVAVISRVMIPQPTQSEESKSSKGSFWSEIKGGFQFLVSRRGLLYLSFYFTFVNFITAGIWRLMAPYILVLTDNNERILGVLMTVSSLGLVSGGLITIIWQGTRPRIHTILPSMAMAGLGLMVFAVVRSPIALGIVIFIMMLPYKMNNALLSSIQQAKIPPDMQGRVFGLLGQISIFAQPIMLLATGPIIDQVLEPAVGGSNWDIVAPILGSEAGAGIGLYILICGVLLSAASLIVYAMPTVRHLERDLPNYVAAAESVEVEDVEEILPETATSEEPALGLA